MDENEQAVAGCLIALTVIFFFMVGPIFSIWSINCLFGTEIVLNFQNWCAMAWIIVVVNGVRSSNKN